MRAALPENASPSEQAKDCIQECATEFILFTVGEGSFSLSVFILRIILMGPQLPKYVRRREMRHVNKCNLLNGFV